jgi:hypothetical protein
VSPAKSAATWSSVAGRVALPGLTITAMPSRPMTFSCPGEDRSPSLAARAAEPSASVSPREDMAMSAVPAAMSEKPLAEPAVSISMRVGCVSPGTVPLTTQVCPSLFFARPTSVPRAPA